MKRQPCFLCGKHLASADKTEEHIVLNAIGGRKKVFGFLCRVCNSETGSKWDADLARQLEAFSLMLGITRQRGDVPSQTFPTYRGGSVRVNSDGKMTIAKPKIRVNTEGGKTHLDIEAPTRREARQILEGLSRKYPQLSGPRIDALIATSEERSYYSSDPIGINPSFGGTDSGRSLVKSAAALVFDAGVDPRTCDLALDYLSNDGKEPCFGYYYEPDKDLLINRPPNSPIHCVYVRGCSNDSNIVGYIELYSLWRVVLCLSESYTGRDFHHAYAVDPIGGNELDVSVKFDLSVSDIREAYENKRYDTDAFHEAMCSVLDKVREIDFNRARARAIEKAINDALAKSGLRDGDIPSDEQVARFASDVADGLTPFVIHNMRINEPLLDIIRQSKGRDFSQSQHSVGGPL